jgi:Mg2+ and Co2+ transporter CorA
VTGEEEPRPYRPYATWFMLIVFAVIALAVLGEWLKKKYG